MFTVYTKKYGCLSVIERGPKPLKRANSTVSTEMDVGPPTSLSHPAMVALHLGLAMKSYGSTHRRLDTPGQPVYALLY